MALFTRKKTEFVQNCETLDRIEAADQRIAANRQEIAASEFWTAHLNSVREILGKVIAGQTTLSPQDLGKLAQIRAQEQSRTDSPRTWQAIEGSIALIEIRTGQIVPAALLDSSKGAAR